jgi:hypothetical protein
MIGSYLIASYVWFLKNIPITFCELGLQKVLHFEILTISAHILGVGLKYKRKRKQKEDKVI